MKVLILHLSSKYPITGMEVIKEAVRLSKGMWRPSPGTVYYVLKRLRDEESIVEILTSDSVEKAYVITEKGKEKLKELQAELGRELKRQAVLLSLMIELAGVKDVKEMFKGVEGL